MRLYELFDDLSNSYKWVVSNSREHVAKFFIGEDNYVFMAFKHNCTVDYISNGHEDRFNIYGWEVSFKLENTGDEGYGLVGGKDSIKVMSIVTTIMRDFLSKVKVDALLYSAYDQSRKTLYRKMVRRFLPLYNTFEYFGEEYIVISDKFVLENNLYIDSVLSIDIR